MPKIVRGTEFGKKKEDRKLNPDETLQALNKELKQRFPGLTDAMILAVRDENLKRIRKFFTATEERSKALEAETGAARRIIWAMVRCKGGEIRVPNDIMEMAGSEENQIATHYDKQSLHTVFQAKENDSKIILLNQ